jgi:hypothetical protein
MVDEGCCAAAAVRCCTGCNGALCDVDGRDCVSIAWVSAEMCLLGVDCEADVGCLLCWRWVASAELFVATPD